VLLGVPVKEVLEIFGKWRAVSKFAVQERRWMGEEEVMVVVI